MSQVDQVRSAADIVKVVGDYVKLRKAGVNLVGLCPFHQEKTPSFAVHPTKQIFHCFGCGVGGNVFKFVMLIENLSFPEALHRVAEKAGVVLKERLDDTTFDASTRERAALYRIHEVAVKFFASQLGATAEGRTAHAYFADRGLSDSVIARFQLGYAPSDGQALTQHLTAAGVQPEYLERSGLVLRDAEGKRRFDRFRRRVIFPIANEGGKVVAFGARALGDEQPKYLNSPETPIYTKSRLLYHLDRAGNAIRKLGFAVLVEGYMDCIGVASAGIENVVASCGTSLTESQVRLLSRHSRRAVVNYDPDAAGTAATERSLGLLLEDGFEVKVLALPPGLDPDSFIRRQGASEYQKLLSAAPAYLDYLTEQALSAHDTRTPEGKVAAANALLPYLARVPNPMLRVEWADRLAERLRVDEKLLRQELKRAASSGRRDLQVRETPTIKASRAEKDLLHAFFDKASWADEFLPGLVEDGACQGLVAEAVFKAILEARRRGEPIEVSRLEDSLQPQERQLLYEILMGSGRTPDRESVAAACLALRRKKAEVTLANLRATIQEAEQRGDLGQLAHFHEVNLKLRKELEDLKRM